MECCQLDESMEWAPGRVSTSVVRSCSHGLVATCAERLSV